MNRSRESLTPLDTNVLVRFLVADEHAQTVRATRLIDKAVGSGGVRFVSDVVICEVVRVLAAASRIARPEIVAVLRKLIAAKHLAFDASSRVARALDGEPGFFEP